MSKTPKINLYLFILIALTILISANWHNLTSLNSMAARPWVQVTIYFLFTFLIFLSAKRVVAGESHSFKKGSNELQDFFYSWYRADGKISIFCSDFKWIEHDPDKRVLTALCSKRHEASVFIKNIQHPLVQILRENDVQIYQVYPDMHCNFRFSINEHNGQDKIILRSVSSRKQVSFIETDSSRDPHLINLAKDLLFYCSQSAK